MKRFPLSYLPVSLAALAACTDNAGPRPDSEPTAAAPELAAASSSWSTLAPLPAGRAYAAAAAIDKVIYFAGGIAPDVDRTSQATLFAYNVATNSWFKRKPMPVPTAFMNGASAINGKLYVSGGVGASARALYVHNPRTNTWTRRADMPSPAWSGAQGVIDGLLYVYTPIRGLGNFWRYNPATNKWTTLPVPSYVHSSPAAGVIGGKFYLAGGSEDYDPQSIVEVYDPATKAWTMKAPLPWRSSAAVGGAINGKLYAVEGNKGAVYDPATDKWTPIDSMPTARTHAARAVAAGKLFIIGGVTDFSRATKRVEAYTP